MLTEAHTLARTTDPESSHLAAEHVVSGRAASQRAAVLVAVEEHPGLTSFELAAHCRLDRWQIARRLPEIERLTRLVRRGHKRVCSVSGMQALTWWPAREPQQMELC
jgi:hypothetical protein